MVFTTVYMYVSKFRDGRFHSRKSGMKELRCPANRKYGMFESLTMDYEIPAELY